MGDPVAAPRLARHCQGGGAGRGQSKDPEAAGTTDQRRKNWMLINARTKKLVNLEDGRRPFRLVAPANLSPMARFRIALPRASLSRPCQSTSS